MEHKTQSGSAHAVIILILVAVILGLLGFVFWQNFIQKKDTALTSPAKTSTTTPKTVTPPTDDNKLAVKEWSIQIPVSDDYSYNVIDSTHVSIVSAKLKAAELAAGCTLAADGEDGTVDSVGRGSTNTSDYPSYAIKSPVINGYIYVLNGRSQGMCIASLGDTSAAYNQINDLYTTLHTELKTAWSGIVATN
ncbi:MAG: hypothetical protein ABI716_00785 [Candidatus Saccharibacteria bacterium]